MRLSLSLAVLVALVAIVSGASVAKLFTSTASNAAQARRAVKPQADVAFTQYTSVRMYVSGSPAPAPVAETWDVLKSDGVPVNIAYSDVSQLSFLLTTEALYAFDGTTSVVKIDDVKDVAGGQIAVTDAGVLLVTDTLISEIECDTVLTCTVTHTTTVSFANVTVVTMATTRHEVWVGTGEGVAVFDSASRTVTTLNITSLAVTDIALLGQYAVVSTALAVYRYDGNVWKHNLIGGIIDAAPTAVALIPDGDDNSNPPAIVIGDEFCLNSIGDNGVVERISALQGLPYGNITVLRPDAKGTQLYAGTTWGVVSFDIPTQQWRYFAGPRWLPDDTVVSMSQMGDSAMWVATKHGVALFTRFETTLEDKALHYQSLAYPRHDRYGYVARVDLLKYGDLSSYHPRDGDNDGSWTGYYMASQIYRYMATNDASAKAEAWKKYLALEFLHNVTGLAGFIARTVVKCGEPHQGPDSPVNGWHNSTACYDGVDAPGAKCCWTWKGDTSTDETDGHFYAMTLAHDHLADTDAERERIATHLCAMTNHIIDNNFMYVDVTGYNTTWGYWNPAVLNDVPGKPDERSLNSLEMLSYLGTAMNLCHGKSMPQPKTMTYESALAYLVRRGGYGENLLNVRLTAPDGIAFFDFGNAFYTYLNMKEHAPWDAPRPSVLQRHVGWTNTVSIVDSDDEISIADVHAADEPPLSDHEMTVLREQFFRGFETYWSDYTLSASSQKDTKWSVIYSAVTGNEGLEDPFWALRRWPMELIWWPAKNSQRLDVYLRKDFQRCCNQNVSITPIPPDESPDDHPDDDSMFQVDGGTGTAETGPTSFLQAHWMARAYGFLTK